MGVLLYVPARNLMQLPYRKGEQAIRDNQIPPAMGVNISLYKTLAFGIRALYTGVAGASPPSWCVRFA